MDPIGYRLSVDFGTSNTVAVIGHRDADLRPLLFDGSPTLRSAVFLDANNGLLVGRDAERSARTRPRALEQRQVDRSKAAAPAKARLVNPTQAPGRGANS